MFKNLKLSQIKGLNECKLLELGQMNIICGKNNSGKSTLLEAINDPEKRAHGTPISQDKIDSIYKNSLKSLSSYSFGSGFSDHYKDSLNKTFEKSSIWYEDQQHKFLNQLNTYFNSHPYLKRYSQILSNAYFVDVIKNEFYDYFSIKPETILVPSKRILNLMSKIETGEKVLPSGAGVLNRLFFSRNQPDATDLKNAYNNIRENFKEISNGYRFDIHMSNQNIVSLNFSKGNDKWISAQDSGLGLQDLLVILWFASTNTNNVLLIEEPESHMHPEMQRKLMEFLRRQTHKQFFITTHSNVFVNSAYTDKVFFTKFDDAIVVQDATSRAFVLNDLGYSVTDNLVSDLVILVEGPTDVPVIEEFLIKMGIYSKFNVKIWPLGGDIMDQLDLSVFTSNYKIIALIDKDPFSSSVRRKFTEMCEENSIPVHKMERYSIENYFSLRALREVFGNQIDSSIKEINPNLKLETQIGINVKRNNRKITQAMTLDEISGTDLENFLSTVVERCKA